MRGRRRSRGTTRYSHERILVYTDTHAVHLNRFFVVPDDATWTVWHRLRHAHRCSTTMTVFRNEMGLQRDTMNHSTENRPRKLVEKTVVGRPIRNYWGQRRYIWEPMDRTRRPWKGKKCKKFTRKLGTEFRQVLLLRVDGGFDKDSSMFITVTDEYGHFSVNKEFS